ncbi:MAG: DNA repair protein RecN [Cyanobacteria bacterium SZAS LIN-2]|nr:DNA repair protein RecN [Cyanobacteria bacterium SZAS LIN-3]MBS1997142.1 DNA repair protein RecN [Cyanobacteria bacterium SZAS LIN-2]
MLKSITIRDFALIEKAHVDWTAGLNVLTGETGAGKSILMDALNAVLGGKVAPAIIRPGADKASIEATFALNPRVTSWLSREELLEEGEGEIVIAREISKSGSKTRVNGTLISQNLLGELRALLITVHAQHEARTLMSSQSQLTMLDALGGEAHSRLCDSVKNLYLRKKELADQIAALSISEEERLRKLDFAHFQLKDLIEANLQDAGEDEELANQISVLDNALDLKSQAVAAQEMLAGGDSHESLCAIDLVQKALSEVEKAMRVDHNLAPVHECLLTGLAGIEEASTDLRRYAASLDTDPETLVELENRAAQLATIKRKYGPTLAQAMDKQVALTAEVDTLENALVESEKLVKELDQLSAQLSEKSLDLSTRRKKLAKNLSAQVEKELVDLGMEKCRFEISFVALEEAGPTGLDKIDFLIAPNPGQPPMPLGKIASGGELSRIMLAIKSIFASADEVATVIFDEIDTGLSGRVLNAVRDKLAVLSRSYQILCITHQPIVASVADNYLEVSKEHKKDSTVVSVKSLDNEMRLRSLAAMASGNADGAASLSFAQALMDQAGSVKAL